VRVLGAVAPSGIVTFLFTDVEGSTRRWETDAEGMRAALVAHTEVLRQAIESHDGWLFKHTGDGVCAAFASLVAAAVPEITTAITHLRDVLGDQTYESLARTGATMTTATIATYAYDQIDQARTGLAPPS
jgi:class 3 adenylate cyclase